MAGRKDSNRSHDPPNERAVAEGDIRADVVTHDGSNAKQQVDLNEASPLLYPRTSKDDESLPQLESMLSLTESVEEWSADSDGPDSDREETKSNWYLLLMTLCMFGLQITWSVELSNGSPYLISLGISKSLLAMVWLAGPLSGTLVQPYIGMQSDRCRSRFGKRRPFMVGGAIATIVSLIILAWTKEIVGAILNGIFGISREGQALRVTTIVVAIIMIFVLDIAINVIQAGIRAFIVDNTPPHQQDTANAWASRVSGVGNIVGYLFGYVDLPRYFSFIGDTEFKILCVVASVAMFSTLAVSCLSISERDPRIDGVPFEVKGGLLSFFRDLFRSMRNLPPQVKAVCFVQFFAWIGWFPFLFYTTTYIAEMYSQPIYASNPNMTEDQINEVWQEGTRQGTFALFIFAITNFAATVFLPMIVTSSYKALQAISSTPMLESSPDHGHRNGYFTRNVGSSARKGFNFPFLARLQVPGLTLRRAWLLSHLMFAILMWSTVFTGSITGATIIVTLVGIPWAMTNWAPFALIAEEISKRDAIRRSLDRPGETLNERASSIAEDADGEADQAGVVLGIHNVAIASPQIVATLVSSAIFRALQQPRGTVGDNSVSWVMRFGGLAAMGAAWLTTRVREDDGS